MIMVEVEMRMMIFRGWILLKYDEFLTFSSSECLGLHGVAGDR
jgi:hypothetical protein